MYLPQPLKSLLVLAGIAAVLFAAYQHPYIRSLVNREAAKQGIVIDPKSPEAQILRAKGSYDDRSPEQIREDEFDRKLKDFRSTDEKPMQNSDNPNERVYGGKGSYSDGTDQRKGGRRRH